MKKKSVIEAKFLRLQVNTPSTKLFKDLGDKEKRFFDEHTVLLPNEEIILSFFPHISYWWALSNVRLILFDGNEINYFLLSEIEKLGLNEIFENQTGKEDCSIVELEFTNKIISLKIEKNTWHAIYNLLKFVIS